MNIKKLAASLMMLSLCTVGVENVSAAAAPMATPPERLINDLDTLPDDAPEKQLYNELYRNKRTRLLDNATYSPKGITSLKKYLGYALQENPNLMNDIREATPMRANAIMARMASLISAKYHNNARDKMESVRNVLNISNACLDALVVSGIAPQPFLFYGFLDHQDKKKRKELEKLKNYRETIVFYESPHRISKTLKLMQDILGDRHIALCREITKKHEEIIRGKISEIISITAELKGEMVIVVSGNNDNDEVNLSPEILITEVDNYVNKGMSVKDAIKEVSKLRKVNKNELYALYHSQND